MMILETNASRQAGSRDARQKDEGSQPVSWQKIHIITKLTEGEATVESESREHAREED